uniref:Uncharacterized protein n=1 Tax=Glossina austeni TaxID=7395 RepID=A0A1A9UT07_GLOAU
MCFKDPFSKGFEEELSQVKCSNDISVLDIFTFQFIRAKIPFISSLLTEKITKSADRSFAKPIVWYLGLITNSGSAYIYATKLQTLKSHARFHGLEEMLPDNTGP